MISHNGYAFGKILKHIFLILTLIGLSISSICVLCACDGDDVNELFQPSTYITFVLNNGENDIIWKKGDAVPVPEKDGYEFLYWCTDIECESKADLDFSNAPESDITLYAKWAKLSDIEGVIFEDTYAVYDGNKHSIGVNLPSGASIEYACEHEFIDAGTYDISATIRKDGCKDLSVGATLTIAKAKIENVEFEGSTLVWDGEKHSIFVKTQLPEQIKVSYTGNDVSDVGEHLVIARFDVGKNYEPIAEVSAILKIEPLYHTVIFDYGDRKESVQVAHGTNVENPPTPTGKKGYVAKWSESLENVTKDMTVSISYTLERYYIVYNGGSDDKDTVGYYDVETEVTLPIASKECYVFDGWYNSSGEKVEKIEKGSVGNIVLYAHWTPIEYRIYFHGENKEYVNDIANTENSAFTVESKEFVLKDPTKSGYTFEGWYDNPDFEGERITVRKEGSRSDLHLYAKWSKNA